MSATKGWAEAIGEVHREFAGALNVNIVTAAAGVQLVAASMLGDPEATMLLRAILDSAAWIKRAPRQQPVLCMCCPQPIRRITPATVFGVAAPAIATPGRAIGFAFCDACGERPGELMAKATEGLRRIWPDMREIRPVPGPETMQ